MLRYGQSILDMIEKSKLRNSQAVKHFTIKKLNNEILGEVDIVRHSRYLGARINSKNEVGGLE
jgi:hypothetical protein